ERRYFFFSSRRRHTRFSRDWSSDVCSSDLFKLEWGPSSNMLTVQGDYYLGDLGLITGGNSDTRGGNFLVRWDKQLSDRSSIRLQIGRASCRETLERIGGSVALPAGRRRPRV